MPAIICLGDVTTHGGKIVSVSSTMFIDGIQVALIGDIVSCPIHGSNKIIEGAISTQENGMAVVVENCLTECGSKVISLQHHALVEE
ncbi:PAAR domain-containing protein [Pluralibacter gergoviae]|nr:PAAR domain-containing protein [Pluralibacter gergoviae]ELW9444556.1 PAAR domain-containing protein [Pluralibacter gergoviae]